MGKIISFASVTNTQVGLTNKKLVSVNIDAISYIEDTGENTTLIYFNNRNSIVVDESYQNMHNMLKSNLG